MSRIVPIAAATVLGASSIIGISASAADAATITACVKKSNGDIRILKSAKKKCKKGWKKTHWSTAAPKKLMVVDGNGTVVGTMVGLIPDGVTIFSVLAKDGGIYIYLPNGRVLRNGSPNFQNNTCTGTAYIKASSPTFLGLIMDSAGGPSRILWRTDSFGSSQAWAFTRTQSNVNMQFYQRNGTGACVADGGVYNGAVVALQAVTAPKDYKAPLKLALK